MLRHLASQQHFPKVSLSTEYGKIFVDLYSDRAPKTTSAFLNYIGSGQFSPGNSLHIAVDSQLKTLPEASNSSTAIANIVLKEPGSCNSFDYFLNHAHNESVRSTGLHHIDGSLSLAIDHEDIGKSQLFFCIGDQPKLDQIDNPVHYSVFGRVSTGKEILRVIQHKAKLTKGEVAETRLYSLTKHEQDHSFKHHNFGQLITRIY